MSTNQKIKFVFFGSSPISLFALDALEEKGMLPSLLITQPDKPKGRGLELSQSPTKVWAEKKGIEVITPSTLKDPAVAEKIRSMGAEVAVLVSYGKIIPESIISIFPKGILNMHPSLLPKLRGPSPIEFTILNLAREEVGISVMLLDKDMDTGPVLSQKTVETESWPLAKHALHDLLGKKGAEVLAEVLPKYINGEIAPVLQNNALATYSRMIEKEDGKIDLSSDPYQNYLKILAFEGWPGAYFIQNQKGRDLRIKITGAEFQDGMLKLTKVIPEGKKEMDHESFLRGLK